MKGLFYSEVYETVFEITEEGEVFFLNNKGEWESQFVKGFPVFVRNWENHARYHSTKIEIQ